MSGTLISIIPRTDYTLEGPVRVGEEEIVGPLIVEPDEGRIWISEPIRWVDWSRGVLSLRMHAKGSWGTSIQVSVAVINTMPSPDEPQTSFLSADEPLAAITLDADSTAPALYLDDFSTPIDGYVRVALGWMQGGSSGAANFAISVDLIGRT
ncbi:MAG: hypothetical protein U0359_25395 [Byssovorax sp.]